MDYLNLDKLPDKDLINHIKYNDELASDSITELTNRHGGLINKVYNKYSEQLQKTGICPQDLYSDRQTIVYSSAISYNEDKGAKFSSWLYNQVRFYCLNTLTDNSKEFAREDKIIDYLKNNSGESEKSLQKDKENIQYIIDEIEKIDDERAKKILTLRYLDCKHKKRTKWKFIAKSIGTSTQTAITIHNKWIKTIKRNLRLNDK